MLKPMDKMNWLDLYNFLYQKAHDFKNLGKFPWQEEVKVFDWETLEYYSVDFIETPDGKISFVVDTISSETTNGT